MTYVFGANDVPGEGRTVGLEVQRPELKDYIPNLHVFRYSRHCAPSQ